MKRIFAATLIAIFACAALSARDQWSVKKAQKWEKEVGVLKGANGYYMVNPSKSNAEVFKKMSELGFNSVRAWIGGSTPEAQIEMLEKLLDDAAANGLTVSPVLTTGSMFKDPADDKSVEPRAEAAIKSIISHFRGDKRIVYWDLWNEPPYNPERADVMRVMNILEKLVLWAREAGATQPLSSSIFWDSGNENRETPSFKRRLEVESMMDIHNYHDYTSGVKDGSQTREVIHLLKSLDDRPIVCSECLNRQNGSGIERTLSILAEERVHFYVWGVYANDRNWSTRWGKSEFDPYSRMFHNMLYADGDLYSAQEVEWVKNFRFLNPGETLDPGVEITDRWQRDRIWRRMAAGPVKGYVANDVQALPDGYNCINVSLSYKEWKADPEAVYARLKEILDAAAQKGVMVLPTLLSQKDGHEAGHAEYVHEIIMKFQHSAMVYAWNLYQHPEDAEAVRTLFRAARNCQPNQPMFMVPQFGLKAFPDGFDYRAAMVHGKTGGWEHFDFGSSAMEQVCSQVWNLSDVIAFEAPFKLEPVGWIGAVARRYGRPVFAFLDGNAPADAAPVLDLLSRTQLYWWTCQDLGRGKVESFGFKPSTDW